MTAINRIRGHGYSIWLASYGRIAVKPKLPDEWREWVASNRSLLIAELRRELRTANAQAELQHCVNCLNDRRSPYNPKGGLTGCYARDDVTPMLPGTRSIPCALFEAANDD